jgi:sensor histidine kinase YesM
MVPNLILQPIVENAVRYAVAPRESGGSIKLKARATDESLVITVCDDGPGIPERLKERVGFSNTRARLEQLYGANQKFAYTNQAEGGVCVTLEFPLRIGTYADDQQATKAGPKGAYTHR